MSWVEVNGAGWGWVEMDGAGWRWVHGLAIPPSDRRNFLHYTSAHPRSLIKSIPHSQALFLKKDLYGNSRAFKESSSVKESSQLNVLHSDQNKRHPLGASI